MTKKILYSGIQVVGILFVAFGGFLAGIAPPQEADAKFAVGIASFLALIVFFIISAFMKKVEYRNVWTIGAGLLFIVAFFAAIAYKKTYDELTFEYPPGNRQIEQIAGTIFTSHAEHYRDSHPGISNSQLLAKFGGIENKQKVWTFESIVMGRMKLITSYIVLILSIAGSIFASTEGLFLHANVKRRVRQKRVSTSR